MQELPVTIPFRPIHLSDLPPGLVKLAIKEPLHVTLLVLTEQLRTAASDIASYQSEQGREQALRQTATLARFYLAVANNKLANAIRSEFRDGLVRSPQYEDIHTAPAAIAEVAMATSMIQTLGLQAVAHLIEEAISRERDPSTIAGHLEDVAYAFDSLVMIKNQELLDDHGIKGKFELTAAIRLVPPDVPRLLLFPAQARKAEVRVLFEDEYVPER